MFRREENEAIGKRLPRFSSAGRPACTDPGRFWVYSPIGCIDPFRPVLRFRPVFSVSDRVAFRCASRCRNAFPALKIDRFHGFASHFRPAEKRGGGYPEKSPRPRPCLIGGGFQLSKKRVGRKVDRDVGSSTWNVTGRLPRGRGVDSTRWLRWTGGWRRMGLGMRRIRGWVRAGAPNECSKTARVGRP